jgi:hypothetical protein
VISLFFSFFIVSLIGWANAMYALKSLDLLSNQSGSSSSSESLSVIDFMQKKFPKGYNSSTLKQYLASRGVNDIEAALEAVEFLGLNEDCKVKSAITAAASAKGSAPIDALCKLLEERLAFGPTEKDMVAMFHLIVGEMPDGTMESHASRLLAFGTPGGDSAMSATVGYTTAAAAELVLDNKLSETELKGVVIPTDPRIYKPLLKRIQDFGITWTDTITRTPK